MKITGSELIGNIIIGDVLMRVWIDPIGKVFVHLRSNSQEIALLTKHAL